MLNQNNNINLSYVLTTYNKLPYLKLGLERLIQFKEEFDEIIIIDGGSTDGTKEYLEDLKSKKKIDYFISEKDHGEADGFNKGLLVAKGQFIKIMTDDDPYDYDIILACKDFLNKNESIDILFANIGSINSTKQNSELILAKSYEIWFRNWEKNITTNCFLCGLSIFIRNSAISYIGLFDTSYKHIDLEYSVRLTTKKTNVAFCTGLIVCANINSQSISQVSGNTVSNEVKRVSQYYNYEYPLGNIMSNAKVDRFFLKKMMNKIFKSQPTFPNYDTILDQNINCSDLNNLNATLVEVMKDYNKKNRVEFIYKIHNK